MRSPPILSGPAAMRLSTLWRSGWLRMLLAAELMVVIAVAGGLWLLRTQAVSAELSMLSALARAMSLRADETLGVADTVLRATREELVRRLIVPGTPEADAVLRARVLPLTRFSALSVFDDSGARAATSRPADGALPGAVIERDFFTTARQAPEAALYISKPYVARADGHPAISVSMNWRDEDGRFRGVLALVTQPDFLDGDFARIAPTHDTRLDIHRADGSRLRPLGPDEGQDRRWPPDVVPPPGLRHAGAVAGELATDDGRRRLVAAASLNRYPLTVVVSRDADIVLAGWTDLAWLVGAFVASMLAVTVALGLRATREQLQREQLELRLQRSRKLEALGQLAGGVAHDFNNLLAAVIGFGEMARQAAPEGSAQARQLDQVLQAGQRGRQLVERILAFSRGQPRRQLAFLLQPVVNEVLEHLAASPRPAVQVQRALQAPEAVIKGDPTAVYEAVMNLCTNALQAMPDGGTLRVTLDASGIELPLPLYDSTLEPGRYARLAVADSGAGMAPEVLARLFEPFFTTKAARGGTGLGLAVVHGVASDLRGAVDVRSAPGAGSCFTLYLPVVDEATEPAAADPGDLPLGRGQTVLVVDDEPALVELAEELLAKLGYEPLGTTSSVQALEEFRREPGRFDLLLTDEVMPELTGTALARAVRELRPDLPVVLASGYGGDQLEARAGEAGIRVVVAKPLTRAELARALDRAVRADATSRSIESAGSR